MNKLPIDEIVVSGDVLRITGVSSDEMANPDDSHNDGEFHFHNSEVKINEECDHQGFFRVLLHEAAHHRLCWGGLEGALRAFLSKEQSDALVEALCDTMGSFAYEILRDNPGLQEALRACEGAVK